jgi:hypothetical protein
MRRAGGIVAAALAVALLIAAVATADARRPPALHAAAHWCGHVKSDSKRGSQRFRVRVERGHFACRRARGVIRYVLNHGTPAQGSPGRHPRGWACAWGYGEYHHNPDQGGRSGPSCSRGKVTVAGYAPGFYPPASGKRAADAFGLSAAAARHCRNVSAGGPGETHIRAVHVSCRTARRLARACGGGNCQKFGFTCRWRGIGVDAAETHCKRGRARVYWQNRA